MFMICLYFANFFAYHKHHKANKDDKRKKRMHNIKKNVFVEIIYLQP